ncbi:MAG: membrane protein insertion efficiency factor YidD [Desulfobacterales bacterium]
MTPRLGGLLLALSLLVACAHGDPPAGNREAGPFGTLLNFYQGPLDHLSAVRRGDCPMWPSCSEYSRQAVARHGFAVGWVMTMDRLMRCGRDGLRWAPRVVVNGRVKYLDPLAANDVWWVSAEDNLAGSVGPAPQDRPGATHNPSMAPPPGERAR